MTKLGDICRLRDENTVNLPETALQLRRGPFALYGDNLIREDFDDYVFPAGTNAVLVPAMGQITGPTGYVCAVRENGAFSTTRSVHVLVPNDPSDGRYLWRAITSFPGPARCVTGTILLKMLEGPSLLSASIPWPSPEARTAFADALDYSDARATELDSLIPKLLAQGDALFWGAIGSACEETVACCDVATWHAGTDVPADLRGAGKSARIEGPHGTLGHCDEALTAGTCLMVGSSARHLLARFVTDACHPIAEMRYVEQSDCSVPLEVLFFALRAAGILDRVRPCERRPDTTPLNMDDLDTLPLRLGKGRGYTSFVDQARRILDEIAQIERDKTSLAQARAELVRVFASDGDLPETGEAHDLVEASRALTYAQEARSSGIPVMTVCDDARESLSAAAVGTGSAVSGYEETRPINADTIGKLLDDVANAALEAVLGSGEPDREPVVHVPCGQGLANLGIVIPADTAPGVPSGSDPLTTPPTISANADLVLCLAPISGGPWSQTTPSKDDPRWSILGLPPRNKSNFAWIQHCLWHLSNSGLAILVTNNAPLHSSVGSEGALRASLARSGRVRIIAALPAGITGGIDESPISLMVIGAPRTRDTARCLMIDALALGRDNVDRTSEANAPRRRLDDELERRISQACVTWLTQGRPVEDAIARVVNLNEIESNDCILAPWTYLSR